MKTELYRNGEIVYEFGWDVDFDEIEKGLQPFKDVEISSVVLEFEPGKKMEDYNNIITKSSGEKILKKQIIIFKDEEN